MLNLSVIATRKILLLVSGEHRLLYYALFHLHLITFKEEYGALAGNFTKKADIFYSAPL
jgi:hypothetical protein